MTAAAIHSDFELILTHLRQIKHLIEDPEITEISINWDGQVFVERNGQISCSMTSLSLHDVWAACHQIGGLKGVTLNARQPRFNGLLEDGSRVAILVPPASNGGPTISIRKHREKAFDFIELARTGTIPRIVDELFREAMGDADPKSIAISGATGSGKTTLLNALLGLIDAHTRVGFIEEEAPEIKKDHFPNHFPFVTCPGITIRDLVKEALRHLPKRLIVGEVRGPEAADLIDALNTGHPGSLTTLHANTARSALQRLRTMALKANTGDTSAALGYQIADAFRYVVQMGRTPDGRRVITEVICVEGYHAEKDRFTVSDLYVRKTN